MPHVGAEYLANFSGNRQLSVQSGAESGAVGVSDAAVDPRLAFITTSWSTIPEAIKVGILTMVRLAADAG